MPQEVIHDLMHMEMSLYEGICHGKIGSEGMQQEESPLVRILL
jgi:hypothetical protein